MLGSKCIAPAWLALLLVLAPRWASPNELEFPAEVPFSATASFGDSPDWARFLDRARAYLVAKQSALERDFEISTYERYFWDQSLGTIAFCNGDVPQVVARIQIVGSVSESSGRWLWSWDNRSILPYMSYPLREVRGYGEEHEFDKLRDPLWPGDESDGWAMTAAAALLLSADGAYESAGGGSSQFLLLFAPERASVGGLEGRCGREG